MQSPHAPELVSLPDELLENIIDQLESESLVQLSLTCRRLHFLALPIVFARADIHDTTSFFLHDPPAHILHALRFALFVQNVESLGVGFSTYDDRLLPSTRELGRLISRLPSMKRFYLSFSYSHLLSPTVPDSAWQREVIRLLDLITNRSCTLLSVAGGFEIRPDPGADSASAIRVQSRSIVNSGFRRLLRRIDRVVIPFSLKRLGGRSRHYGLREFRALTIVLFQPPFLKWTISTLRNNSRTLTAVSFRTDGIPTNTWQDILSNITLPYLSKFELTSSLGGFEPTAVPFNSLLSFLTRHPSIVNLELRTVARPTAHHQLPSRKLLPTLETLKVDAWFTVWLLNREKAFEDLTSLYLVSEAYPLFRTFDYNTWDGVLSRIPRSAPHVTNLYISFYPEAGAIEWLDKHVSQENSPVAALESVTTLNVTRSWNMWRREVMALIPQFVARFPGLQDFTYASPPPGVKRATQTSFVEEINRACPRVTVDLGFLADLDTLSQASNDTQEIS